MEFCWIDFCLFILYYKWNFLTKFIFFYKLLFVEFFKFNQIYILLEERIETEIHSNIFSKLYITWLPKTFLLFNLGTYLIIIVFSVVDMIDGNFMLLFAVLDLQSANEIFKTVFIFNPYEWIKKSLNFF